MTVAICTVFVIVALVAGYRIGRTDIDNRSYWQGFADGEATATTLERTPSPN